jgi:hypothetical protein
VGTKPIVIVLTNSGADVDFQLLSLTLAEIVVGERGG